VIDQAPMMTEAGDLSFKIYARSRSGKVRLLLSPLVKLLASMFQDQASESKLDRLVESKNQKDDMPGINAEDVVSVVLSFFDLRNAFGYEVDLQAKIRPRLSVEGGQVRMQFEPLETEALRAGVLSAPIERRLDQAHKPLNRLLGDLLAQMGAIPAFTYAGSQLNLHNIFFDSGDLFVVVKRGTP
jgi:hypothetical protein